MTSGKCPGPVAAIKLEKFYVKHGFKFGRDALNIPKLLAERVPAKAEMFKKHEAVFFRVNSYTFSELSTFACWKQSCIGLLCDLYCGQNVPVAKDPPRLRGERLAHLK